MKIRYDPKIMKPDITQFDIWEDKIDLLVTWVGSKEGPIFWRKVFDNPNDCNFFLVSNVYDEWYGHIMLTHKD